MENNQSLLWNVTSYYNPRVGRPGNVFVRVFLKEPGWLKDQDGGYNEADEYTMVYRTEDHWFIKYTLKKIYFYTLNRLNMLILNC